MNGQGEVHADGVRTGGGSGIINISSVVGETGTFRPGITVNCLAQRLRLTDMIVTVPGEPLVHNLRDRIGSNESAAPSPGMGCWNNTYREVPMTTMNRSDSPGGARKRTQTTAGPAAHYPTRQASQPDPASAAAQRGAEGAAWTQPVATPYPAPLRSFPPSRALSRRAGS